MHITALQNRYVPTKSSLKCQHTSNIDFDRQEYNLPEVKDRQYLITLHKKAKKKGFNVDLYNQLKREVAEVEHDLRRLRDPLYVRYSPTSAPNLTDNSSILSKQHGFSNTTKQPNTLSKYNIQNFLNRAAKSFKK